jgi:hypothetical protein
MHLRVEKVSLLMHAIYAGVLIWLHWRAQSDIIYPQAKKKGFTT